MRKHYPLTLILSFVFIATLLNTKPLNASESGKRLIASVNQKPQSLKEKGFSGVWTTTFGIMALSQKDKRVNGSYVMQGFPCLIEGTVKGRQLTFTYQEYKVRGEGEFEISEAGNSFQGKWRESNASPWQTWLGTRVETDKVALSPSAPAQAIALPTGAPSTAPLDGNQKASYVGKWETTFGPMQLIQNRNEIKGSYIMQGVPCQIHGTVSGNRFTFTYQEPNASGEGYFELASEGTFFEGKWLQAGTSEWMAWKGRKMTSESASSSNRLLGTGI